MQCDIFRSQPVYKWPATGPGPRTHQSDDRWWVARSAPILSSSWLPDSLEGETIRLYWRHPSPYFKADNELSQFVAATVNTDTFTWWVCWPEMVGGDGWPWSRGQADTLQAAQAQSMARLMRMAGYHLQSTGIAV